MGWRTEASEGDEDNERPLLITGEERKVWGPSFRLAIYHAREKSWAFRKRAIRAASHLTQD